MSFFRLPMIDGSKAVFTDNGGEAENYVASKAAKLGRACGSCSLCCKVLDIPDLAKPQNKWCQHCKPGRGGCAIYNERPDVCKAFACLWLIDDFWDEGWTPTRSKMVLRTLPINNHLELHVNVDSAFPYYEQLKVYTILWPERPVCIHIGERCIGMTPEKEVEFRLGENINIPWTRPEKLPTEQKKQLRTLAACHGINISSSSTPPCRQRDAA